MKIKNIIKSIACVSATAVAFAVLELNAFSLINISVGEKSLINDKTTPYKVNIVSGDEVVAEIPIGVGLRGDADENGKVNLQDAIKLAKYRVGNTESDFEGYLGYAMSDTDLNGKVDLHDIINISKYLLTGGTHDEKWGKVLKNK